MVSSSLRASSFFAAALADGRSGVGAQRGGGAPGATVTATLDRTEPPADAPSEKEAREAEEKRVETDQGRCGDPSFFQLVAPRAAPTGPGPTRLIVARNDLSL